MTLTDDKALTLYPFLSALDATTNSMVAKRSYLNTKEVDLWKKPTVLPMFAYEPFSTNVDADTLPQISNLKEFELTLVEMSACPLCEVTTLESNDQLRNHWITAHFSRAKAFASLSCKFCSFKIGCPEDELSDEFAANAVASYLHHLSTNHSASFTVPSTVMRSICPFYGCSEIFFNSHSMKLHLRTHSVITHDLKNFIIPLEAGVESKLLQYTCFLCGKNEDYSTALSFINHCIDKHLQRNSTDYSIDCCHCPQSSMLLLEDEALTASKVMTLVMGHTEHLINEHSEQIEGRVSVHNSVQKMKPMFEHHAVSQPVTQTAKKQVTSATVVLEEIRCLLCDADQQFSSLKKMSAHYMATHLQRSHLQCSLCSHRWLVNSEDRIISTLPLIAGHMHRRHPSHYRRLQCVKQYECLLSACSHVAFSSLAEMKHLQSHHLQLSTNILTPNAWTLPLAPSQAIFTRYCCFRCADDEDLGSLVAFMNHWMSHHCAAEEDNVFSFQCQYCCAVSRFSTKHPRWTKKLFCLIGEHLSHLMTTHDYKQPEYVLQVPGREDLATAVPKPRTRDQAESTLLHAFRAFNSLIFVDVRSSWREKLVPLRDLLEFWQMNDDTASLQFWPCSSLRPLILKWDLERLREEWVRRWREERGDEDLVKGVLGFAETFTDLERMVLKSIGKIRKERKRNEKERKIDGKALI
ncbi:hypothetical protein CAPTEDRAFT_189513 [Capitella teleta]|uniref:C2H2-type domain-containing protein n=1 Tax=Capitella teleta TaxID=283909 RepID=R7TPT2_CAPTE|nr:hypothetical protein CAPTEDRAFT_189513 [Capitella teleta]|eukprot:ELT95878.1 hypothetical protein CAPTEDRAFT_189513 [Capitella teleta]